MCISKVAVPWLRQVVRVQITRVLASDHRGAGDVVRRLVVRHDHWQRASRPMVGSVPAQAHPSAYPSLAAKFTSGKCGRIGGRITKHTKRESRTVQSFRLAPCGPT